MLPLVYCLGLLALLCVSINAAPLDDYIAKKDDVYGWVDLGDDHVVKSSIGNRGYTSYTLNLTSQRWLTDDVFAADSPAKSLWWHYLVVIVPDNLQYTKNGTLYITAGTTTTGRPQPKSEDIALSASIATSVGIITGCLYQIPNERIIFADDPIQKSRTEDAIIAYTWDHYLNNPITPENPNAAEWLVRFPMVKASVRALDAMTEFVEQKLGYQLENYAVAGASKRGWTTWLMGAVDPRVSAIIPIVLDAVNFAAVMKHQYRAYGGFSYALQDYISMNITARLDDPNMLSLQQNEDPFFFFDRLTMPKLVVNSAMDEFQMPDDTHYWWSSLPEPKHFIMAGNAEHSCATSILEVAPAISAFIHNLLEKNDIPQLSWNIDSTTGEIVATVDQGHKLHSAEVWWGRSCGVNTFNGTVNRRDFRIAHIDEPCECGPSVQGMCVNLKTLWSKKTLEPVSTRGNKKTFSANFDIPADGTYVAFFIDFKFRNELVHPFDVAALRAMTASPETDALYGQALTRERYLNKYVDDFAGLPHNFGHFFEFTTEVSILPNTFPYPECYGQECGDAPTL